MNANQGNVCRRRATAMILVLGVIAIASVLSWAMLASTSTRMQIDLAATDAVEASNLADSGVSYAMYYIRYPAKASGKVTILPANGVDDDDILAGEGAYAGAKTGLSMWSGARGTTDVAYATAGDGLFAIRSTSTVDGLTRTTLATAAYTYDRYTIAHAAAFNSTSAVTLLSTHKFNGNVVSRGTIFDPLGRVSNSTPLVAAGKNVTPTASEMTLLSAGSLGSANGPSDADRPYVFDGVTYWAECAPGTITGTTLVSSHPLTNPKNVWFAKNNVTMNNATFKGTLVVAEGKLLTMSGTNTVTAYAEMPAIVSEGGLDMKSGTLPVKTTVNGAVWLGGPLTDSGSKSSNGWLKINGALLFGQSTASPISLFYRSSLEVVYDPAVAKIANLSTVKTINGVAVRSWKTESN